MTKMTHYIKMTSLFKMTPSIKMTPLIKMTFSQILLGVKSDKSFLFLIIYFHTLLLFHVFLSPMNMTLNYLMVRLQTLSFGK